MSDQQRLVRDYQRDGLIQIRAFFSPAQVAGIRAEIQRYIREDLDAKPADASIHHCQTIHHSDPNETENARLGLLLVYRGSHTETDRTLHTAYTEAVTVNPPA